MLNQGLSSNPLNCSCHKKLRVCFDYNSWSLNLLQPPPRKNAQSILLFASCLSLPEKYSPEPVPKRIITQQTKSPHQPYLSPKIVPQKIDFTPTLKKILNQTNQQKKTTQTVQSQKGPADFQGFCTFQGPQGPCRRSAATPFRTTLGYWLADHLQLPTGSPPTANRLTVFFQKFWVPSRERENIGNSSSQPPVRVGYVSFWEGN